MEKLDEILQKYVVAAGSKTNKEQLLGGAYVVVNKDGKTGFHVEQLPPPLYPSISPPSLIYKKTRNILLTMYR